MKREKGEVGQGGTLNSAPAVCSSGELWKFAVGKVFLLNFIFSSTVKKYRGGVSGLMIRTDPATLLSGAPALAKTDCGTCAWRDTTMFTLWFLLFVKHLI